MSRYHGPQHRGAQRETRQLRQYQAYLRQVDHTRRHGPAAADPAEMLDTATHHAINAGHLDIHTYRQDPQP